MGFEKEMWLYACFTNECLLRADAKMGIETIFGPFTQYIASNL